MPQGSRDVSESHPNRSLKHFARSGKKNRQANQFLVAVEPEHYQCDTTWAQCTKNQGRGV